MERVERVGNLGKKCQSKENLMEHVSIRDPNEDGKRQRKEEATMRVCMGEGMGEDFNW